MNQDRLTPNERSLAEARFLADTDDLSRMIKTVSENLLLFQNSAMNLIEQHRARIDADRCQEYPAETNAHAAASRTDATSAAIAKDPADEMGFRTARRMLRDIAARVLDLERANKASTAAAHEDSGAATMDDDPIGRSYCGEQPKASPAPRTHGGVHVTGSATVKASEIDVVAALRESSSAFARDLALAERRGFIVDATITRETHPLSDHSAYQVNLEITDEYMISGHPDHRSWRGFGLPTKRG